MIWSELYWFSFVKDFCSIMPLIIFTKVQFLQSICSLRPFRRNKRSRWHLKTAWFPLRLNNCIALLLFSNASPETPASFRSLLIRSQCEVSVYKRCFISWSKNRLQTSLKRHEAVPERTGRTWVRRPLTRWITLWWNWDGADRADLSHLPGCC